MHMPLLPADYPGAAVKITQLQQDSTGDFGDVRIMDYGKDSRTRYRVAAFCPGVIVDLPGDTPKTEPENDQWCSTFTQALAVHDKFVVDRLETWRII
jgi:hypothetical protein